MHLKGTGTADGLPTPFTLIGLLSCVSPFMHLKSTVRTGGFPSHKVSLQCVVSHEFKMAETIKDFLTVFTGHYHVFESFLRFLFYMNFFIIY
jgi:hypothetical protein